MKYSVLLLPRCQGELASVPPKDYERLRAAIAALADNPRPANCLKLTGRDAQRIRVGDYRVVYEIDDVERSVLVLNVGHRREIYR